MLGSLSAGVSGLDAFQTDMNVIGNNIANVNTYGFKSAQVDFADSFSNTLLSATGSSTVGGSNTQQVGTGVNIDAINSNWSTGTMTQGNPTDLAIDGNGFFLVKDPSSGTDYATQVGTFTLDNTGFMVGPNGYRLQGFPVNATTGVATSSTPGDIQIGVGNTYSVNASGLVSQITTTGAVPVAQLALQNFQDPDALQNVGQNLFSNMTNAGPLTTPGSPNSNGLGTIIQGDDEMSNVDLSGEMANLITAQRGFEANSKIITASDEVLQTVVNMVH